VKKKVTKFGKIKIKMLDTPRVTMLQINFGRYKRGKEIDTWPIYNAIDEKHKPPVLLTFNFSLTRAYFMVYFM